MKEYGVFLGINENEAYKLDPYKLVVIVPSEFTSSTITNLHDKVKTIYGYLNIGSLEVYRPYYERFKDLTLGVYEDWPDEYWIDVSASSWQDFIINELAISYLELGFDGLGDNTAISIVEARKDGEFISIEELVERTRLNSQNIERMRELGILKNLPEKNQLNLFDFF